MVKFKQASKFQTSVISFLVGMRSNKEEIETLKKVFNELDKNKDGHLSVNELVTGMESVKENFTNIYGEEPDWNEIVRILDTDKDGKIDFGEFLTQATNSGKLINAENLKIAFNILDKNKDGELSLEEIKFAFSKKGKLSDLDA